MPNLSSTSFYTLSNHQRMRYAVVEAKHAKRGTILVAPGRREFIEKKQTEMGKEFADRGFNIVFFEWRGQGFSDRTLQGTQRQRDHAENLTSYLDDLRDFYKSVVIPRLEGPSILMGHSLGGHLGLRWLAEDQPKNVYGAIVTAPMLALGSHGFHNFARMMSWLMVKSGHGNEYAPLQHDYSTSERAFLDNPLTQDEKRFHIIEEYFDAFPDLKVGGVTWQWLQAALHSMQTHQKYDYFGKIKVPVLSMVGSADHVTPAVEVSRYLKFIPDVTDIVIKGARHDIMNESDTYRDEAWRHIDAFLTHIGPKVPKT